MVEDKKIIGLVTADNANNMVDMSQRPMVLPRMQMMPQMQQLPQMPFPLIFFFFPRLAMLLMMMRGEMPSNQRKTGIQNITQFIRDEKGRIIEVAEFVK